MNDVLLAMPCRDDPGDPGRLRRSASKHALRRKMMSSPIALASPFGYDKGMKKHTKSSITLPPEELKLVSALQARLRAKSKVEVVRRGLQLLREVTERESLRQAYRQASLATRESVVAELGELDSLVSDGLREK